jgi:hypothetical protein
VVVLALQRAGGGTKAVDTEDVAVAAHELAPTAFAWKKYPDQINLDSVRVTLFDACKEQYGGLVKGSVRAGWHLTPAGVAWVSTNAEKIGRSLVKGEPSTNPMARAETRHVASELARLRRSEAFLAWASGEDVPQRSAAAVFRIDGYTSVRDRELKINRATELVLTAGDAQLLRFIEDMSGPATAYEPVSGTDKSDRSTPDA